MINIDSHFNCRYGCKKAMYIRNCHLQIVKHIKRDTKSNISNRLVLSLNLVCSASNAPNLVRTILSRPIYVCQKEQTRGVKPPKNISVAVKHVNYFKYGLK